MIGYSLQEKFFTDADISLHIRATQLVDRVPYKLLVRDEKVVVRCHELALAVGAALGLAVCDGYYGMLEHSWLWTGTFERYMPLPNILDVYAPDCYPQVVLIHTSACLPLNYRRGTPRTDIDADMLKELLNLMLPEADKAHKAREEYVDSYTAVAAARLRAAREQIAEMSPEQQRQVLIDTGILQPDGKLAPEYR